MSPALARNNMNDGGTLHAWRIGANAFHSTCVASYNRPIGGECAGLYIEMEASVREQAVALEICHHCHGRVMCGAKSHVNDGDGARFV